MFLILTMIEFITWSVYNKHERSSLQLLAVKALFRYLITSTICFVVGNLLTVYTTAPKRTLFLPYRKGTLDASSSSIGDLNNPQNNLFWIFIS